MAPAPQFQQMTRSSSTLLLHFLHGQDIEIPLPLSCVYTFAFLSMAQLHHRLDTKSRAAFRPLLCRRAERPDFDEQNISGLPHGFDRAGSGLKPALLKCPSPTAPEQQVLQRSRFALLPSLRSPLIRPLGTFSPHAGRRNLTQLLAAPLPIREEKRLSAASPCPSPHAWPEGRMRSVIGQGYASAHQRIHTKTSRFAKTHSIFRSTAARRGMDDAPSCGIGRYEYAARSQTGPHAVGGGGSRRAARMRKRICAAHE